MSLFSILFLESFTWFSNYFHLCINNIIFWFGFDLFDVCIYIYLWVCLEYIYKLTVVALVERFCDWHWWYRLGLKRQPNAQRPPSNSCNLFSPFFLTGLNLIDGLLCWKKKCLLLLTTMMMIYTENCAQFNTFTGLSIVKHSKVFEYH